MGKLRQKYRNMPLRKAFMLTVFLTFSIVVLVSGITIWGCSAFCNWLLPDSDVVYLTIETQDTNGSGQKFSTRIRYGDDMSEIPFILTYDKDENGETVLKDVPLSSIYAKVTKAENSYSMLTPKRKLAYRMCRILMVAVPLVSSVLGIFLCGFYFYRRKLYEPLKVLSEATEQIAEKNLDFVLSYESSDELGKLCRSFEEMRKALIENNRQLWNMIEERKRIQASVAHDLRNPIAIIEGYTEYLQINLSAGKLKPERTGEIICRIESAAKRLEQYTESVRTINQLDDIELHPEQISLKELIADITDDLYFMASEYGVMLKVTGSIPDGEAVLDASLLYRVLENIINNAVRYAEKEIQISFEKKEHTFVVTVTDDGVGFSEEVLKGRNRLFVAAADADGHSGIGLTISRLLCRKHGGRLELSNGKKQGAVVRVIFGI